MKRSVFGILKGRTDAEAAVTKLKDEGFMSENVSVLFPEHMGREASEEFSEEHSTKAPEGATTGGTTGFVIGGVLGWLASLGTLAIPGVGPFIAAGPLFAALTGAAVGAAVGGIAGALIGMGIPEYEAKHYEARVKEGNVLISVHADDDLEAERARVILLELDAEDVAASGEVLPHSPHYTSTKKETPDDHYRKDDPPII